MATSQAYFDPTFGKILPPNFGQLTGAMPVQNAWAAPPPPNVAQANQQAQQSQAETAAAQAAAGGVQAQKDAEAQDQTDTASSIANAAVQNQKNDEAATALGELKYGSPAKAAAIQRQFGTANAIRNLGASLNTGSQYGGAPNWAGALANVAGAYLGKKQQDEATAAAQALGSRNADLASLYYGTTPTSYF